MRHRFAVVGGGVLGLTTALLLATDGHRVDIVERRPELWGGASAAGEGKIHLGPVYALADTATHLLMMRGAFTFGTLVERAVGRPIDWDSMASDEFDYLVMPGSLADSDELTRRYRAINVAFADARTAGALPARYLGRVVDSLIDTCAHRDDATGLVGFRARERAVDPTLLGRLMVTAAREHPLINIRTDCLVTGVDFRTGLVRCSGDPGAPDHLGPFGAVVNCSWEGRSRLAAGANSGGALPMQNIRVKATVRLRARAGARTVTLIQGPFGDVVAYRDHIYASWYPEARVHQELTTHASAGLASIVADAAESRSLAERQVAALRSVGILEQTDEVVSSNAGVILGNGEGDIDHIDSGLHHRGRFGVRADGRLLTPMNYKLTTAPLAARAACDAAMSIVDA